MKAIKPLILALFIFISFLSCYKSDTNILNIQDINDGLNPVNSETFFIQSDFKSNYLFNESYSRVKDRNFYWTTLVENNLEISNLIKSDVYLSSFLEIAKLRLNNLTIQSSVSAHQYAEALKFSDDERVAISQAIKKMAETNAEQFIPFTNNHITQSGAFNQFREVSYVDRLHQLIVEEMMLGINQIIDTYAAGIDPLYPTIDKVGFNVNSGEYRLLLASLTADLNTDNEQLQLFYEPFLKFALGVLELNQRDEAGRYFPMTETVNIEAYNFLQNINWDDFDYSVIVVLGDSPNSPGDLPNISLGGMARADYGVTLFNQGKAPLIAFTGGHLFPIGTPYSEAIEMKKYIMDKYDIPENRILVDPHARHTTTNLRNIGRQFYRYGIPINKKAIVSTSKTQSEYVASNTYLTRCQREMNHVPMQLHNRLSDFDIEFTANIEVLHLDSSDPLDP